MPNPTFGQVRDESLGGDLARVINQHEQLSASHAFDSAFRPAGAFGETYPRSLVIQTNNATLASGQLFLAAIPLLNGSTISSITFVSGGTAAGTPTNQWFCLYDKDLGRWAVTADDTSTAWAGNTAKTLNIGQTSATANGTLANATTFVVPYSGLWYVGIMVAATTPPTLRGKADNSALIHGIAPIIAGTSTGSLTTPSTAPAPAAAITATVNLPYAYVK